MRAKFINEDIHFERGKSVKSSLRIGSGAGGQILFDMIFKKAKESDKVLVVQSPYSGERWSRKELVQIDGSKSRKEFKIIMKEFISLYSHLEFYIILMHSDNVYLHKSGEMQYHRLNDIEDFLQHFNRRDDSDDEGITESYNFERGVDPKDAMRIGRNRNNPILRVRSIPYLDLLKRNPGTLIGLPHKKIIKAAAELLEVPEERVLIFIDGSGNPLNYDHEIFYEIFDNSMAEEDVEIDEEWYLMKSQTGEVYIMEIGEGPVYILGAKY
jgi:hypothetical protein